MGTIGNWAPPCRVLVDGVGDGYMPIFLCYVFVVNFAMVQVIRAVFIHETFKAATLDTELMIKTSIRQKDRHIAQMMQFFFEADANDDDFVSVDEFCKITSDERVRSWLGAMGFNVKEARWVFDRMSSVAGATEGMLTKRDVAFAVEKLKGNARS